VHKATSLGPLNGQFGDDLWLPIAELPQTGLGARSTPEQSASAEVGELANDLQVAVGQPRGCRRGGHDRLIQGLQILDVIRQQEGTLFEEEKPGTRLALQDLAGRNTARAARADHDVVPLACCVSRR